MTTKERFSAVEEYFLKAMPEASSELNFNTPFELLVAVVLSAQCTDKRVNLTTPALFAAYPTAEAMAKATPEQIYQIIRSISYPNNKARHLVALSRDIVERFGGEIPRDGEALESLPGVGRKTANLTVAVGFNLPAICVDVHVHRICNWLKLIKTKTPLESEMALRKILPVKYWKTWNSHLVSFGQTRCNPVRPKCVGCPIAEFCESPKKRA